MNLPNYKSYIEKLCIMSNNYYMYDEEYIKNKYNIKSYDKFRKFFKQNHSDKLIFNSEKAENFFIKVMNLNSDYMFTKYGKSQSQVIVDFFIQREECNLNDCDEYSNFNNKKSHMSNCECKIKVKSVVNLSINALIFILIENDFTKNNIKNKTSHILTEKNADVIDIDNSNIALKITKLYNTESNKKIIDSIKKIESIKNSLGITKDNTKYLLTDTKPDPEIQKNILNNDVAINTNQISNDNFKDEGIYLVETQMNEMLDNPSNIKKFKEQLISESINLEEENENGSSYKNKIFKKTSDKSKFESEKSDSDRFNNLTNFAKEHSGTDNNKFKIENMKSSSSNSSETMSNRFGNVVIKENKVKIEKKQPVDLNNSSDILVSYNETDFNKNIINNFIPVENLNNKGIIESDIVKSDTSKSDIEEIKIVPDTKREVIEILNYLDVNFNYITSDDILIDKDKKMQICTFMVEVKYKIFGMFRQLEKDNNINQRLKSRITSNYEKIYYYVVQSNKIGSTGEMVEFNKNKELIKHVIEDIIQI